MNVVRIRGRQGETLFHSAIMQITFYAGIQIYSSFKETWDEVQLQTFSLISVGWLDNDAVPFQAISHFSSHVFVKRVVLKGQYS